MMFPTMRQLLLLLILAFCATDEGSNWQKQVSLGKLPGLRQRNTVSHLGIGDGAASHPACEQSSVSLSPNQKRICRLNPDHMASVNAGVQLATEQCQHQLQWRRWNCTTSASSSLTESTAPFGSRESSLVHASLAAGIMYSVSRACREGRIAACGCRRRRGPRGTEARWSAGTGTGTATTAGADWQWVGCGDDTEHGYKFTTSFVDARQREKNYPRHSASLKRTLANLHNNEAGRLAVNNYVTVACKCHGVSGSCVLKTCWRQLPEFRAVGDRLLGRYDSASLATFNRHGTSLVRPAETGARRRRRKRKRRDNGRRIAKEQLVYVERSPDYCPSTGGRRCVRRAQRGRRLGKADCGTMCCGRGYNEYRRTTSVRCRCRFVWCCRVDCDVCRRSEDVLICK